MDCAQPLQAGCALFSGGTKAEFPATKVVRLAWAPTSHGQMSVSVWVTTTSSALTPNSSATIWPMTVSAPWPISVAPVDDIDRTEVIDLNDCPAPIRFIDPGSSPDMDHRSHSESFPSLLPRFCLQSSFLSHGNRYTPSGHTY